ncbi:outer membrane lipid asymmetry maintenance protein MlaD [Ovoidimarina sediminis]|uniref:outer membrane lipid asymmetry maintenance protein MlaD n=1 Tax=Ovoidimarina sediminis TaxID=3079856 RepID=UPI002911A47D|nr:outer membrane lipid asymmetry maintenance protein MlaD [Rhodophyticola sp. MJ-SS7]MDU8945087.1 outer membrane lipid asymmetry maintenance protein MlaD [Rhodophyticola sp. MJ-SS7]
MSSHVSEVVTGGVVVAAAVGFLVYASQFDGLGAQGGTYPLSASFRSAEGVTVGTDIRLAGVKIGTVTGLELDPATYRAEATFAIRDGIELPDDTYVSVASEGLLGGTFIEISPGGSQFTYGPGDEILDTESSVSIISLLLKFVSGGEE